MPIYKMQINACNITVHHILKNEVDLILPKFYEGQKSKRGIFGALISGFIGLAFEGIPSLFHHKRHNALHKAVKAMSVSMNTQRNKLMYLENTLIMYGIDNAETLEKLVKMVHTLHSRQSLYESYLLAKPQQLIKHIHRCMVHAVFSTTWSIQCFICVQLRINILKFIMSSFQNYASMPKLLEF